MRNVPDARILTLNLILPNPDDPDCGNICRNLTFPDDVYEQIQEYREQQATS